MKTGEMLRPRTQKMRVWHNARDRDYYRKSWRQKFTAVPIGQIIIHHELKEKTALLVL